MDFKFTSKGARMSTIYLHQTTTLTPEQYIAGLTDFGPGRSKLFGNSADEYSASKASRVRSATSSRWAECWWNRQPGDAVIQITPQMRILVAIEAMDGRKGIVPVLDAHLGSLLRTPALLLLC
jgi:hypothetical protein